MRADSITSRHEQRALLRLLHDLGVIVAHGLTRDATTLGDDLSLKMVVVVDDDVDVTKDFDVLWAMATRTLPGSLRSWTPLGKGRSLAST